MTRVAVLPRLVLPDSAHWPGHGGDKVVLLSTAATDVERELVDTLAERLRCDGRRPAVAQTGAEAAALARANGAVIAPVRVVWLPAARSDSDRLRLRELPVHSGPARVRAVAQRRVLDCTPERCRILVGEPAGIPELEARWSERTGEPADDGARALGAFVGRQADIVLERAERRLTGERYRAPQRVAEELVTSPRFIAAAETLAAALGREPAGVIADAAEYLTEMATEQQRLARDLWTSWSKFLYSRAYELHVDDAQLAQIKELAATHPLVYLPSHRSNLDGYIMASLLHEHGLPPNHTLGGINMAFWPLGPVGRRVGVIWIRRSFRGNEVYKLALRQYLGYLVSKRFNLEWYIEGGRSRTGKLLPPRLGLFNYLADAVEELGIDELRVIPVSIVYDELQEVHEMTAESRGRIKQGENAGWLLRFAREQRGSFGRVHVNFGEPLVLADALRAHGSQPGAREDIRRLARSKAAFEVCTRINRATPVTTTALVTLALLGAGDRAMTLDQARTLIDPLRDFVRDRAIPGQDAVELLGSAEGVRRTLSTLVEHGVVECYADGPDPVYRIGPDRELAAAFYRNSVIHWFLPRSIVELALIATADSPSSDAATVALDDAFRARDLLKFEFFFPDKEDFRRELLAETDRIDPDWRAPGRLAAIGTALTRSGALIAHRVLRSFVEAYVIVADELLAIGDRGVDTDATLRACLNRGRQYRFQHRVSGAGAVSTHLFRSALKLAANRGLLEGRAGVASERRAFACELDRVLERLRRIDEIERARILEALANTSAAGRPA
jgi:glycerol-3-phosphate O-acyltransferase